MLKRSYFLLMFILMGRPSNAQQTIIKYLSGTDKDHTILWDFYCTEGRKSGEWSKIAVPSNWETQGFGTYNYFTDGKSVEEKGLYRCRFTIPANWGDKTTYIVFEGAMTDTEVKINGTVAGPLHQGGFYRFKYDISRLVKPGADNLLEVTVSKHSANASINQAERHADFWQFGGIYRPVYLEATPKVHIDRLAINAQANGLIDVDVFGDNLTGIHTITAQAEQLNGVKVGVLVSLKASAGKAKFSLHQQLQNIRPWNPESPNLYRLVVTVAGEHGIIHRVDQKFGFRTMELRQHDGIYVNGKRVIFKGVCRHSEWPESGRTMSKELSLLDIGLMKEMNMNAVRMSHYPPDQHFLDVCDSLGMFVLDELTGWQTKYDTVIGRKLVKELVVRDVNHPSIVLWDNGNEGGWNTALDNDYALYDPQRRPVIHPWEKFNGTDTKHYPDYNYVANSVLYGNDIFFPTEFMHGNYDGGSAAGLDDYWSLMLKHPYFAGGFLWSFADEGVVRTDKDGQMDTANDSAPDGIVGPHREKEGSFFAIKEIWSPVVISNKIIPMDGRLTVENRYIYTNLGQCTFSWQLVRFPDAKDKTLYPQTIAQGKAAIALAPGEKGFLNLNLPALWPTSDVLVLKAADQYGKEIFTWTWAIRTPTEISARQAVAEKNTPVITALTADSLLSITSGGLVYNFSAKTGYISSVIKNGKTISLNNGPVLAGADLSLKSFRYYLENDGYVVQCNYSGVKGWLNAKWLFSPGRAVKLEYQYSQKGDADYMGITFNYPEDKITGMKWMGRGPYRVYKNRLKGQQLGIWHKDYNNTITGESWTYPEFKGYHAELYWVTVENRESPFTIYTDSGNMFLQMLRPAYSKYERESIKPHFPDGSIGFLNAISPIGTRFQQPELLGPQGQKNIQINYTPVSGALWFDFR